MNPLLTMSATKLAEKIRNKEITSLEVVEVHIQQIEKVNPILNAVVKTRFDLAREEAKQADELIKNSSAEKLPLLLGVPCTIKECFAVKGMPNTSGLVARKDIVITEDATAVSRLKNAGAIPLGVTNVSELCMWMESSNKVYGRTNNPYNPKKIVGGSSGGEGAIIGAGGSPFGLGSDIGGSIRMPAFFNGVFGHKPSGGLVPETGQFPFAENEALRYLATGPLARRAEDLMLLLKILAGPDGKDKGCQSYNIGNISDIDISKITVLDVKDNGAIKVSQDLQQAQKKCAKHFADKGAQVKELKIDSLKNSLNIWSSMLSAAGGDSFSYQLGNGKEINILFELIKWIFGKSPHTFPAIILALIEKIPKLNPERTKKLVAEGLKLREELTNLISANGVMLYPPYSSVAPSHNKPIFPPFNWVYTAILNVMELPVTQVPLGLNKEGLPLGVQIVGVHGNDHLTIAVALELEKAFGGWTPPTYNYEF